jgi:cysteine desulfurase
MLPKVKPSKKVIYMDHAATTPLDPRVKKTMEPFWSEYFGNPSSLYKNGREGTNAISAARKTIAQIINASSNEIIFTAGGSESINLAILGVARQYRLAHKEGGHIIASAIEHHAVLHCLDALKQEGFEFSLVDVDEDGFIDLQKLKDEVRPDTILISVMYANNEIGTIEPITEIGKWVKAKNLKLRAKNLQPILFHTDACQAAGSLDLNVEKLGVDLLSANGSKIYGPKQTGFLYVKSGVKLRPLIFGGGQEKNLRSGTENVPGIVGLAEALRLAQKDRAKENKRLIKLRDYFIDQLFKKVPKIVLNGPDDRIPPLTPPKLGGESTSVPPLNKGRLGGVLTRLPNNINISILDIEGEALLLYLDSYNIAMSTGSACTSASLDPSHVILAIGRPYEYAHGSMRFTLGKETTKTDIDYVMKVLPEVVKELRRISPVNLNPEKPTQVTMEKAFVGQNMNKFRNKKVSK